MEKENKKNASSEDNTLINNTIETTNTTNE